MTLGRVLGLTLGMLFDFERPSRRSPKLRKCPYKKTEKSISKHAFASAGPPADRMIVTDTHLEGRRPDRRKYKS
jgi:hypothetical protein